MFGVHTKNSAGQQCDVSEGTSQPQLCCAILSATAHRNEYSYYSHVINAFDRYWTEVAVILPADSLSESPDQVRPIKLLAENVKPFPAVGIRT